MRRTRHALLGALVVTLALAGMACSSDDDPSESGSDTSAEADADGTTTTAGGEGDPELAAFCDSFAEVTEALQGDEPPPAEEGEALLVEVEETAPEELSEPIEATVASARDALAGNEEAFDDAFFQSIAAIDSYRFDNCPVDERVEVTGVEYAFEGAPSEVAAGTVAFKMSNEGEEEHEMILFARARSVGTDRSWAAHAGAIPGRWAETRCTIAWRRTSSSTATARPAPVSV